MRLLLGTDEGIFLLEERSAPEAVLTGVRVREIAQSQPGSPTLYLATPDRVYRSDDTGQTWRETAANFPGYEISSLAIHPWEPEVLLAGLETAALFRSADGGRSWTEVSAIREMSERPDSGWHVPWGPAKGHVRTPAWDRRDPRRIYLPIEVGGVVRTADGGETWENVHGGIHDDVHALAVHPERNAVLYAATRTGFGRSEDHGGTWERLGAGLEHPYCRTIALGPANPERLYTAGASEGPGAWRRPTGAETALFRSDDGARSWKRLRGGLPESFRPYINALVTDPQAPDTVAFGTDDGEVYLSRDAGERWERIAQAPPVRRMRTL
jgi:photosystem II stability/assembly factor-like uncharacterized protein